MKKNAILKTLFVLCSFLAGAAALAQTDDSSYIHIHTDPRLPLVVNKPQDAEKGFIGKRNGFRVQIYNGNDRKKASQVKVEFMRLYPGVRSYLVYNNPQFRVRVGDFVTRSAAHELYSKVSASFNPCMIVPDVVNVNTTKKSKGKEINNDIND